MNVILQSVNVSRPRFSRLMSVFGPASVLACLSAYFSGACAQAAVASSRQFEVQEDTPLQATLANTDPNGTAMSFRFAKPPVHGQLQLAAGGAFTYIPEKDFDAYDSFSYIANDGTSDSAEATVGLMMKPVNDAPEARPFALSVPKNRTLISRLQGFDVDRDSITYWKASDPAHGTAIVDFLSGRFTYTPVPDFVGDDSFGYQVRDGAGIESAPATVSLHVGSDGVGVIADTLIPQVVTADFPTGPGSGVFAAVNPVLGISAGVIDQAVDRMNRRLYVLTGTGLSVYDIDRAQTPPALSYRVLEQFPVTGSHVVLSLDGRTAFIGAKDKVTAINLYDEAVYVAKDQSTIMLRGAYRREFAFPEPCRSRGVAAMGVHPAGDRLFVIVDMDPADKKRNINNDLLRSDVGNGTSAAAVSLPADFGFILELDIAADVQTEGAKREQPKFSSPVNIRNLLFADVVAFGIKSIAFSPDGNYALLSAVGAQTSRATPFGIMPTSDEGTGGILVVDVRPGSRILPDNRFLAFIPTTERGEKTAELRREIQKQGFKIVHPQVQAARRNYSIASGVLPIAATNQFTATEAVNELILGAIVLDELERSYADYGYMEAYMDLYPRDMVGASSVAISHDGGFGVVALQDTNNLGLLSLALSTQVSGYTPGSQPDFYIARGTRKTVNGFDPALGSSGSSQNEVPLSWAYPQEVVFTSDDSRIYIGMAGGTPKADTSNKFGSADAFMLRSERDRSNSIFAGASPSVGYAVYGGTSTVPLKSPRVAAALQAFDSSHDQLSDQLKAYNRWNSLRPFTDEQKHKLVSTDEAHLTVPGRPMPTDSSTPDCLSFGYLLPPSGVGYRLNRFGMPADATSFATRGVVSTIEQMGLEWDKRYRDHQAGVPSQQPVTRPYFVVGLLSQPGGGIIRNRSEEALKYTPGNGSEVDFPYFSIGSDAAHDFISSNGPNKPSDNSVEETVGFDKVNTEALIRLLLAQPQVKLIELDPLVLDQVPGLAGDPRIVVHGSSGVRDWRRDLDNHMFVTFGCASVDLDIDSDNNGVLDRSPGEDAIEDRSDSPGKFVSPNTGDTDNDSVPNYADGYDRFPGQNGAGASEKFTELKVRFPDGLDLALLQFRLIYSESSPSAVGDAPDYTLPTDGAFRIWTKDGDQARGMAPIDEGGDYIPSNRAFLATLLNTAADRTATLFVESVGTGFKLTDRNIIIEVGPIAGSQSSVTSLWDSVVVSTLAGSLAVDANRDGSIRLLSEDVSDATSRERPYRFWINDDDDDGGDVNGNDVPGAASPDGQQVKVQGTRDLVDFFPVFLDLKQLLTVLPPSTSAKYKLKSADDGLRFVYTDLCRADAFKYLKDFATGNSLKEADAHWVTAAGYELDATWLNHVRDADKGVILVEGRNATDKPLVLSVEKTDGTVIAEAKLETRIVPVETMFRHLNLHDRNLPGLVGEMPGGTAQPEAMGDPAGFPDNPNSESRWLIFVHGFNVGGQASRGWNAEMFKRFYWSGNKARFVGVSWFGNPDDAIGPLPSDYYRSVRNAMVTAPMLAQEINALPGTKTIVGHSLGCGVISSAIADDGMSVSKACFVDAALARECFDGEVASSADGMTPSAWKTYDSRFYAANWSKLFPAGDARSRLTWRNRFLGAVPVVHNFYSSTENVLGEYTGEVPGNVFEVAWTSGTSGAFTWVFQEKAKGVREDYILGVTHVGSYYGGWGFNTTDPANVADPVYYNLVPNTSGVPNRQPKTNEQIGAAADDILVRHPVFDPGWGNPQAGANRVVDPSIVRGPSWIAQLYDSSAGPTVAALGLNRNQLLAEAIPALTWPVGSHAVQAFEERNYPLTSLVDHWPRGSIGGVSEWRHSDMREVAYLYQHRLFDKLVTLLNQ